jgi:hypothetical protein
MTILFIVVFLLSNNVAGDDRIVVRHRLLADQTLDLRDTTGTLLSANNACWMEHGLASVWVKSATAAGRFGAIISTP